MQTCEYYRLLSEFWARTGLPVRQAGLGPGSHQPPCLAYSAVCPAFGGEALMEADAWFGGATAAQQRDEFLQALETMLPERGIHIAGDGGMIIIRRSENDFVKTEEAGAPVLHVRIRAAVRLYG